MSAVLEARAALCAVPFDPGRHSKGTWLREAARLYRISESFAKKIYYGEKKRMDADTLDRMRVIREQLTDLRASARVRREKFNELADLARGSSGASGAKASTSQEARRDGQPGLDRGAPGISTPDTRGAEAAAALGAGRAGEGD